MASPSMPLQFSFDTKEGNYRRKLPPKVIPMLNTEHKTFETTDFSSTYTAGGGFGDIGNEPGPYGQKLDIIITTLLEKFRNVPGNFWATNVPNFYQ